jgi:hypothetical protein
MRGARRLGAATTVAVAEVLPGIGEDRGGR